MEFQLIRTQCDFRRSVAILPSATMEWNTEKKNGTMTNFRFEWIKISRTKITRTNRISERSTKRNRFGVLTRPNNPTTNAETTSISGELLDDLLPFLPLFLPKVAIIHADLRFERD
jgi:hypothetical protein